MLSIATMWVTESATDKIDCNMDSSGPIAGELALARVPESVDQ